jgi:ribosomal-protein-alanine N-acetyltransferase
MTDERQTPGRPRAGRIKIEAMDVAHIREILEIERTLFPTPWTQGMFEQELLAGLSTDGPGSYAVVALEAGRVAGYIIAWFVEEGVHLMNIAVRKDSQRRGVGKRLMRHLITAARAARKTIVILEVRVSNMGAQAFYEGFGFQKFGVRRGYYADNREDAILMALDLSTMGARRPSGVRKTRPL